MNGFGPSKGVGDGPDQAGKLKKCGYAPNCFSSDARALTGVPGQDPEP